MKHAFLIIAHDNFPLLQRLLCRLDNINSNIYIHIDKKARFDEEEKKKLVSTIQFGKVVFLPPIKVTWGAFSMIDCELRMLKRAVVDQNDYYHILSGHDYLLVDIETFMNFFDDNDNREFIGFSKADQTKKKKIRYSVYWIFQNMTGKNKKNLLFWINYGLAKTQYFIGVDRTKKWKNLKYETGSQWCSITKRFANHLIEKEKEIRKLFRYTLCSDEMCFQTMFINSATEYNNYLGIHDCLSNEQCLRAIDWNRGNPYVYSAKDFNELITSKKLICRKVDTDTKEHLELLNMIDDYLNEL